MRALRCIGFAILAGALVQSAAGAQVRDTARTRLDTLRGRGDTLGVRQRQAPPRDTTREVRVPVPPGSDSLLQRDSLMRRDSVRAAQPQRDTIKAPFKPAEAPVLADPNGSYVWDRRDMFSTGALTVQDLLDRVPGLSGFRSGWISQPISSSFLGDPRRIRIFLDGLELESLDPRSNGIWDLTQIPLWALDDLRVERSASEIRILMRSWRVDRTTPFTRTDIYTGDQGTNLYRGLFGRRYRHGEAIQIAGQQYGTSPGRNAESSDQFGALVRTGVARRRWSADAFLLRNDRNRGATFGTLNDTIPSTESTRTDAYVRVGIGSSTDGLWTQAIASASRYGFGGKGTSATANTPAADTSRSRSQYVLSGGYTAGPWRASVTQRYMVGMQRRLATPSARLGFESKRFTASAFAEGSALDSTARIDLAAVVRPLSFVFVGGAIGRERPRALPDSLVTDTSSFPADFARLEAGIRVGTVWLSGGVLRRDPVVLDAPALLRSGRAVRDTSRQAIFGAIRGRVWKSLYADFQGMQWSDSGGFYRPRYQTRSELFISTSLLGQLPSGNFHLLASAVHEYRSSYLWPDTVETQRMPGYRTISTLLQVRILNAEVFWNFRNIMRERYENIPGYRLPRGANIYGVRWEFWN